MKLTTCILIGAILGVALPMFFGGPNGVWMSSFASIGTIRPLDSSPGLLFSAPVMALTAFGLKSLFAWHS